MVEFKFHEQKLKTGNLGLVVKKRVATPVLFIVDNFGVSNHGTKYLVNSREIVLQEPREFNGLLLAMIGSSPGSIFEDNVAELYLGKRNIASYLDSQDWHLHAQWIRNFKSPVERFPIENIRYVPAVYGEKPSKK